jgi:hypothetical protein
MTNLAIRLQELSDAELEEFVEIWVETKSRDYLSVERIGGANDKGRDVTGFLTARRHEGEWDLYQCKRKTRDGKLGLPEALTELGKVFHHHVEGAYATLPRSYVFVAPRGIVGPCRDTILNPSRIAPALINGWDAHCLTRITTKGTVALSPAIRSAIEGYDFTRVTYLTAPSIVKSPAAGPALTKVLGTVPGEAPPGVMPDAVQEEELPYVGQLVEVYSEAGGGLLSTAEEVLADGNFGEHLRLQRTRFFEAASFKRFHRDNTDASALLTFTGDVLHGVIDTFRRSHATRLHRLEAVMERAGGVPMSLLGRDTRIPVRQGMCHHHANDEEGPLKWNR